MRTTTRVFAAASISALSLWALAVAPVAAGQEAPAETAPLPSVDREECTLTGTQDDDVLEGTEARDVICGLGGNDAISGFDGRDVLKGGPGDDELLGGADDDHLYGGLDSDLCRQNDGAGTQTSCEWPNPLETCPVKRGTVYDNFGAPRPGDDHQGVDIDAKKGTPILATHKGKMKNLRYDGGGLVVQLRKPDGSFTYSMHMSKHAKERRVKPGDTIGYVGSSGNAGGDDHLHFEWHPGGGDAVDPYPYLDKLCKGTNVPAVATSLD